MGNFLLLIPIDIMTNKYYNIEGERKMKAPLKEYLKEIVAILLFPIPIMFFFGAWMWFFYSIPVRELEMITVPLMFMTMMPLGIVEFYIIESIGESEAKICTRLYLKIKEYILGSKIAM